MSNQQPEATARKNAPHRKRQANPALAFSLIPAAVVAGIVLLIGIAATPPRYIARASFMVDWNSLPSVPNGEQAEKARNDCRMTFIAEVTSLPDSEQEMSEVLDHADNFTGSQADKAAVISKLQRRLHVALASQTDNGDLFTIETRDDDPNAAQAAANWVLHGIVSKLKAEAEAGSGLAVLRSSAGAAGISQKKKDLEAEKRKLEETYSRPFPDGVQERYDQIKAELEKLPFDHAEAGVGSLSNPGGLIYADPIKVGNEAQVEKRGAGYGLSVFLAAVVLGGIAKGFGLLLRQLALAVTALKAVARSAPRQMPERMMKTHHYRQLRLTPK